MLSYFSEPCFPDYLIDVADDTDTFNYIPSDILAEFSAISEHTINATRGAFGLRDYHKTATVTHNGTRTDLSYDDNGQPINATPNHPAMHPGASTSFQLIHSDSGRVYRVTIEHISN
jgi:hypothetical protein